VLLQFIFCYRQHCTQCKPPVFNLLRGRFWGFSPRRGNTLHRWGWNLAQRSGPSPPCQISPHRCNDKGVGPQKLQFFLRFDQNVEHKHPAGAYPLRDFHKICRVCTPFQNALAGKVWLNLLEGLWSYGGFKLRGSGYPQIFSAPYRRNCVRPPKVLEAQERARGPLSPCQVWWSSDFTRRRAAINVEFFCLLCLSVCSSRFWTSEIVRPISPWTRWSTETVLTPLDRGRFIVVHPCLTFSDCCLLVTPLNVEVQIMAEIGVFRHHRTIE